MSVLCRWFGHRWVYTCAEQIADDAGGEHWWYEFSRCTRCGEEGRELVASPQG